MTRAPPTPEFVPFLCEKGMTFPVATDIDLAALRAAVQPVYDQVAGDPQSREWLNQIEAIKTDLGVPPDTAACPATDVT